MGTYRWRLCYTIEKSEILDPQGAVLEKKTGGKVCEEEYTEFQRLFVDPGNASLYSPGAYFYPGDSKVTYQFYAMANIDTYAIVIYRDGVLWKIVKVKQNKKNPAEIIEKTIGGHQDGSLYYWEVQGLNYDKRKPDLD